MGCARVSNLRRWDRTSRRRSTCVSSCSMPPGTGCTRFAPWAPSASPLGTCSSSEKELQIRTARRFTSNVPAIGRLSLINLINRPRPARQQRINWPERFSWDEFRLRATRSPGRFLVALFSPVDYESLSLFIISVIKSLGLLVMSLYGCMSRVLCLGRNLLSIADVI